MPLIQVNMAAGRTDEEKKRLMEEITRGVETALGVSPAAIRVWINEFRATEFMADGVLLADRAG
jgi:4-oxalocrotonate tautomerase